MKKIKKVSVILLLLSCLLPLPAFSRTFTEYEEGSYIISLRIPFDLPVAYWKEGGFGEQSNTHTAGWGQLGYKNNVEFALEVGYEYFIHSKISLGGMIGYHFAYMLSNELISRVPFVFKVGYYPLQGKFEIPIVLGVGGAYMTTKGYSIVTMYLSFETGLTFYWNDNWGIGFRTGMHIVPEFKSSKPEENNFTFFVPVVLQVSFRR